MSARSCHNLHQFHCCRKEISQTMCTRFNVHALPEFGVLRRDPGRAVVGIADASGNAANGLHGSIGHSHAVRAQA